MNFKQIPDFKEFLMLLAAKNLQVKNFFGVIKKKKNEKNLPDLLKNLVGFSCIIHVVEVKEGTLR